MTSFPPGPRLALIAVIAALHLPSALAASLDTHELRACLASSRDPAEAGSDEFRATCERPPSDARALVYACEQDAGPYCTRQLQRLSEGEDSDLEPAFIGTERHYLLRRTSRGTLNGNPMVELVMLDRRLPGIVMRHLAIDGCAAGQGRIDVLRLQSLGVVTGTETWSSWRRGGPGELDRVAEYICVHRGS